MDSLLQDIRYAARTLRANPTFTIVAVVCLALGIATNTTLFSCFDAIVLRPFPAKDPAQLVELSDWNPKNNNQFGISWLNYLDWREQTKSFNGMAAYSGRSLAITEGTDPERLAGMMVTWNLFPLLGIQPQLGRGFREDEDKPGAPATIILSDGVWRRHYGADSSVINRVISVNNEPRTVVGVMPPEFRFPENSDAWVPLAPLAYQDKREWRNYAVIGRMKPELTVARTNRELADFTRRLYAQYDLKPAEVIGRARPLAEAFLGNDVKLIVSTMMGAVTFVLLIAVANVANLMLSRAAGRRRELAVRSAIGAGRGRIVRQLLTEAVIVALIAGVIAVPLTWEGLRLLDLAIPAEDPIPYYMKWHLDATTLLYTAAVSIGVGMLFGLAPALEGSRGELTEALKDGARGAGGSARHNRLRSALVIVEVALALVLLVGASLFTRTFIGLGKVPLGFDPSRILTMRIYLPGTRYDSTRRVAVQDLVRRMQALPGVEAATISNSMPLDGGSPGDGVIIDGKAVEKGKEPRVQYLAVAGHWFETLGVQLESGRTFTESESRDLARVAVIDRRAADRFWPNQVATGRRFRFASDTSREWYTVIGVTPNIRINSLDNSGPIQAFMYVPYAFVPARNNGIMLRLSSASGMTAMTKASREAIRSADPAVPVFNVRSMEKVRDLSFWQYGLFGAMFGIFGAIALFLAGIGVYGVISYGVSQRTREIGVRVALGAQRGDVIGLVVRQGMTLAVIGMVVGLLGAFGVTRVVGSLLIGVSPTDPLSFISVPMFLAGVAFLASFIPARRATRVDPIVALRVE